MATCSVSIEYRPIKVGLVVREGSVSDIWEAAGLATLMRGGMHNPILPVGDDSSYAERLAELFGVDVLVPVTTSAKITTFLDANPTLRSPWNISRSLFYENWGTKRNLLSYLDILDLVGSSWNSHFKFQPPDFKSNCVIPTWETGDSLADAFAVEFGFFPEHHNLEYDYRAAFADGLRADAVNIGMNANVAAKLSSRVTPIRFGSSDLNSGARTRQDHGVFLGDETKPEHLISFWNLRAAGSNIIFLSVRYMDRQADWIRTFLDATDQSNTPHVGFEYSLLVYYHLATK